MATFSQCGWAGRIRAPRAARVAAAVLALCASAAAGTFGRPVPIGGQAADLALDEARGVLYVANFTANRVEVVSLADGSIQTSINVGAQPNAVALSPDGRYLTIGHFGNFAANAAANGVTVIELDSRVRQTYATRGPVLALAYSIDGRALVFTSTEFSLFDPVTGSFEFLETVSGLVATQLPVQSPASAVALTGAAMIASGDGRRIWAVTDSLVVRFDVERKALRLTTITANPPLGPRALATPSDGSFLMAGWVLFGAEGHTLSQIDDSTGAFDYGSVALDAARGILYTSHQSQKAGPALSQKPMLTVRDADNLRVRETIQLTEPLAGKSVITSDGATIYAASASGVMILPVGALNRQPRIAVTHEDVFIRGNFCDRRVATQEIGIISPGGVATDFTITSNSPGVRVTPSSGVTPATIRVTADPSFFQNLKGSIAATLDIKSAGAINLAPPVRVLVSNREPDQRGTIINISGRLTDLIADPGRDRFFVIRQDTNEVLVYDGNSQALIARLRTANYPVHMAVTLDRRRLLVAHENAQVITVYDLETLEAEAPVLLPRGYYARSVAASGKAILAACRKGSEGVIMRVDLGTRTAVELPSLGIFRNQISAVSALAASPNGSRILIAQESGEVMLYDANADTFTVSRKVTDKLSGAYGASSYDQFVAGNLLMNSSLVVTRTLDAGVSQTAGFAFVDQGGIRLTSDLTATAATTATVTPATPVSPAVQGPALLSAGVLQRLELPAGQGSRSTRLAEAPYQGTIDAPFTRTLAPLYSRNTIVVLSMSGVTVLPWTYDAAVAVPLIDRVANAADGSRNVATGGLVSIFGRNLSPVNAATREIPLPTALGESCLTVNGVPTPVLFVSPTQINAQLPFNVDGNVTMVLRTPGGTSDNHNLVVRTGAPAVFLGSGETANLPLVVRASNRQPVSLSNPIHRGEALSIYLTGLGRTFPELEAGVPGPANPPAVAVNQPEVTVGGFPAEVRFAGLTPGEVGVYQVDIFVPKGTPLGVEQPLVVRQSTGSATVPVRVVD